MKILSLRKTIARLALLIIVSASPTFAKAEDSNAITHRPASTFNDLKRDIEDGEFLYNRASLVRLVDFGSPNMMKTVLKDHPEALQPASDGWSLLNYSFEVLIKDWVLLQNAKGNSIYLLKEVDEAQQRKALDYLTDNLDSNDRFGSLIDEFFEKYPELLPLYGRHLLNKVMDSDGATNKFVTQQLVLHIRSFDISTELPLLTTLLTSKSLDLDIKERLLRKVKHIKTHHNTVELFAALIRAGEVFLVEDLIDDYDFKLENAPIADTDMLCLAGDNLTSSKDWRVVWDWLKEKNGPDVINAPALLDCLDMDNPNPGLLAILIKYYKQEKKDISEKDATRLAQHIVNAAVYGVARTSFSTEIDTLHILIDQIPWLEEKNANISGDITVKNIDILKDGAEAVSSSERFMSVIYNQIMPYMNNVLKQEILAKVVDSYSPYSPYKDNSRLLMAHFLASGTGVDAINALPTHLTELRSHKTESLLFMELGCQLDYMDVFNENQELLLRYNECKANPKPPRAHIQSCLSEGDDSDHSEYCVKMREKLPENVKKVLLGQPQK